MKWPEHDYCGTGGCDKSLLSDGMCHSFCTTMACNYDNGYCEAPQGETKFCYNNQQKIVDNSFEVCPMYKTASCCTNMEDVRIISEKIREIERGSCGVDPDCMKNIKAAFCAYCSPDNNRFMRNGTARYCSHFSEVFVTISLIHFFFY